MGLRVEGVGQLVIGKVGKLRGVIKVIFLVIKKTNLLQFETVHEGYFEIVIVAGLIFGSTSDHTLSVLVSQIILECIVGYKHLSSSSTRQIAKNGYATSNEVWISLEKIKGH